MKMNKLRGRVLEVRNIEAIYESDDMVLWITEINDYIGSLDYFRSILSMEVLSKINSIGNSNRKSVVTIQQGLKYIMLSQYLGVSPLTIEIYKDEKGKPYLDKSNIYFNYSHSENYFMLGISKYPIGVDIQVPRKMKYNFPLSIFSLIEKQVYQNIHTKEEREEYFWAQWTLKEAYSKALGFGMTMEFSHILKADLEKGVMREFHNGKYYSAAIILDEIKGSNNG